MSMIIKQHSKLTAQPINWILFDNDSELTIPTGTTWELKSTGGAYNISNDAGTIINEGTLIINSGKTYPFINEGTFVNKGLFKIQKSTFFGFINEGITENYGIIESSNGVVSALKEKPTYTYYANGGAYLIKKKILSLRKKVIFLMVMGFKSKWIIQYYGIQLTIDIKM